MLLIVPAFLCFTATAQEKQFADEADTASNSSAPLSLSLNGTDSYLAVSPSAGMNLNGAFTVELWVKTSDYARPQTLLERFDKSSRSGRAGYSLHVASDAAVFTICPGGRRSRCASAGSAGILVPNVWQHIAAVYDGEMRVYVNGQLSGTQSQGVPSPGSLYGQMRIGATVAGTQMFGGKLDEIRISNAALYNGNFTPAAQLEANTNTVGLWRFDGGSFNDSSIYNHYTTMNGGATFSPDVPTVLTAAFQITPTPNVGTSNTLNSVKTISPSEVWAVGEHGPAGYCCFPKTPVILRWDGAQWNNVPVQIPAGMVNARLYAIDASSPTNVWAIGTVAPGIGSSNEKAWFLRWDGVQWNTVAVVSDPVYPQYGIGSVTSITVISETDVWVVGARSGGYSWTLHWDGTSVQTVPSPNLDNGNKLNDIDAINSNDIWAVGSFMVIRWNGTEWLPVPNAPRYAHFSSVAAIAPNDVWATATFTTCGPFGGCSSYDGLYHFDGTQWTIVPVPGVGYNTFLEDLSATASDNVWLVGSDDQNKTFVARFDGTSWQRVASENTPASSSDLDRLLSVSALNSTEVWTVGFASDIFYDPQYRAVRNTLALRRALIPIP